MTDDTVQRLIALEITTTEQERTIEELSGQLAAQWAEIDRLTKIIASLVDRFMAVEDRLGPDVPVQKPPHW